MALRLNGSNTGYVELDVPADAGSHTLTLPDGGGTAHQVLKNSATAGTLEYGLALPTGNGTSGQYLQSDGAGGSSWQTLPDSGKILQVVQGIKTDTSSFSVSGQGQFNDVLTTDITPVAASSKILVMWYTSVSTATHGQRGTCRILRGTTAIGIGDSGGSRILGSHGSLALSDNNYRSVHYSQNHLDTPTYTLTDTLSYKLQVCHEQSAGTVYINRDGADIDANTHFRGATYMILMEVAG